MLKSPHYHIFAALIILTIASLACSLTAPAPNYLATAPPQLTQTTKPTMTATLTPTISVWTDCVVTATALNVRACPGLNCAIVGWLLANQTVNAAPATDGWLTIMLTDGHAGYIAARYCDSKKTKGR